MRQGRTLAISWASALSALALLVTGRLSLAMTEVIAASVFFLGAGVLTVTIGYGLWASRGKQGYSDGSGLIRFNDGSTGRTSAPALEGYVIAFVIRPGTENAGYRVDANEERFRIHLRVKVKERLRTARNLGFQFALVGALCALAVVVFVNMRALTYSH